MGQTVHVVYGFMSNHTYEDQLQVVCIALDVYVVVKYHHIVSVVHCSTGGDNGVLFVCARC